MAFQSVPDTVEIVPKFTINGRPVTMTFYAEIIGGYDQTAIDDLADQMDLWAAAELIPLISLAASYDQVTVRGLESALDVIAIGNASAGPGTDNGQPLPNVNALAVKRSTGFTGRSARGRVYFPLTTNALSANEDYVTSTFATNIVNALESLRTELLSTGWTEVLVSRNTAGAPRVTGFTLPITGYSYTDLALDTQRRRGANK